MSRRPHIFLIGPGGTGKSTLGPIVADRIGASFVDLDQEVCVRVAPIPVLVREQGYARYCEANSMVADSIVGDAEQQLVIATSSGFLAHDEQPAIVARNADLIRGSGLGVLVLPSLDLAAAAAIIAERQARRYGLESQAHWNAVTSKRLPLYRALADVEMVAHGSPEDVSDAVLQTLGQRREYPPG